MAIGTTKQLEGAGPTVERRRAPSPAAHADRVGRAPARPGPLVTDGDDRAVSPARAVNARAFTVGDGKPGHPTVIRRFPLTRNYVDPGPPQMQDTRSFETIRPDWSAHPQGLEASTTAFYRARGLDLIVDLDLLGLRWLRGTATLAIYTQLGEWRNAFADQFPADGVTPAGHGSQLTVEIPLQETGLKKPARWGVLEIYVSPNRRIWATLTRVNDRGERAGDQPNPAAQGIVATWGLRWAGAIPPAIPPAMVTAEDLDDLVLRAWDGAHRDVVANALLLLPAADHGALSDVDVLWCESIAPIADQPNQVAVFRELKDPITNAVTARLLIIADDVFDQAAGTMRITNVQVSGGPGSYQPVAYGDIVHEVGHAVVARNNPAGPPQAFLDLIDLVTPGALLTDYAASPEEAYAEAYRLYLVDPEFLRAREPDVFAWFEAGNR